MAADMLDATADHLSHGFRALYGPLWCLITVQRLTNR